MHDQINIKHPVYHELFNWVMWQYKQFGTGSKLRWVIFFCVLNKSKKKSNIFSKWVLCLCVCMCVYLCVFVMNTKGIDCHFPSFYFSDFVIYLNSTFDFIFSFLEANLSQRSLNKFEGKSICHWCIRHKRWKEPFFTR